MEFKSMGSSLPVPCVQELVKEPLRQAPPRYVRLDQDPINVNPKTNTSLPQIPIIDMNNFLFEDLHDSELQKFHLACKDWGFFQLKNHGVSSSLVEEVKTGIKKFFDLEIEEKKKLWQKEGEVEGFGQAFVVSEEQKLDWGDMFFLSTLPPSSRKPHLFPNLPLPFRDNLEAYAIELQNLAKRVLDLMAKALGMKANDMKELFEEGWQSMRMNYYPPCPQPEHVIGLSPHSDSVALTILLQINDVEVLQINDVEGLQIKKDNMWIPVTPLPSAFIVNIGDILEVVTNGVYRSIEHRAVVNTRKERLSIATFYNPNFGGDFGPAPSLVTLEKPALFKRIGVADYIKALFQRELKGKSFLDVMRIKSED